MTKLGNIFIAVIIFFCTATFASAGLQDAFTTGDSSNLGKAAGGAGYNTDDTVSFESTIAKIINTALSFVGVIFLCLMVYGGYLWMTARGAEDQVTEAKNLITAAVIGLVIVISAYAITYFVVSKIGASTLKTN